MEKAAKGAWIIHHGRKIQNNTGGSAEYSAIDIAAKAASLLARMAASNEVTLTKATVDVMARAGGLNPKIELNACLQQLQDQSVISISSSGDVAVLGVTGRSALSHAADLFESNDPQPYERASLELGEITSTAPVGQAEAAEFISDTCKLTANDTGDFLSQAISIGFVDHEGPPNDAVLFNGNLFKRNTAAKTKKILDSLSTTEATVVTEFTQRLNAKGAISREVALSSLGDTLFSKLRAAAVFDENVVSNEAGEYGFITAPGAFHKFSNPMEDDAFDQAKALVAALKYGMSVSSTSRGQIWGISLLLRKLLRGGEVGPAPAIGQDYRALEIEGVVSIRRDRSRYFMSLRKKDVGEIAYSVLTGGDASATIIDKLPGAAVTRYTTPEASRTKFRQKKQTAPSKKHTRDLLSALRSSGGL